MEVIGLYFVLLLTCFGQIKCGRKDSVDFSHSQLLPISVYPCEDTNALFEHSAILRNINDDGDKVLDVDVTFDEPFTPEYGIALKIDLWDNGAWKEDVHNFQGNFCDYLNKFAEAAWKKVLEILDPQIEEVCAGPAGSYKVRNLTLSTSDFTIPISDYGLFRALLNIFDPEGDLVICQMVEIESNLKS